MTKETLLKTTKCIICGNENLKRINGYIVPFLIERMFENEKVKSDVLFCENCNFYFSEGRPNDDQMERLYKDYRGELYQKQREKSEPYYTPEFNNQFGDTKENILERKRNISKVLNNAIDFTQIENVLDYGGDRGQFIPDDFKNSNKYVYEISGLKPIEGVTNIESVDELTSRRWDFIMCCQVLEHVSYPMKILNHILSIMPKGGYLYVEVPYENYVENPNINPLHIHEHINFFRPETLSKIFEPDDYIIIANKIGRNENFIYCLVYKFKDSERNDLINRTLKKQINEMIEMEKKMYSLQSKFNNFEERINQLEQEKPFELKKKNFLQQIFSLTNEHNHKSLTILGIKIKVKRKR